MNIHPISTIIDAPDKHAIPFIEVRKGIIMPGFMRVITIQRKKGMRETIIP
jgi:hypothetical protein